MNRLSILFTLAAAFAVTASAQVPIVAGDISPRNQIHSVSVDPTRPASSKLEIIGYQPLVEVKIDGKPAGLFLIATGWARTTIFSTAAEKLELTAYDFAEVRNIPHLGRRLFNAGTLSFGAAEVDLQGLWTEPGVRTTTHLDTPISGIIGWDILGALSFTLSASSEQLTIHAGGLPATTSGSRFQLAGSWRQFPVINVPGLTATGTVPLLLDTAIDAPLYLSKKTFRSTSGNPTKQIAVQAPNVATGRALSLSTVFRTGTDAWAPLAPTGTPVYVGDRPAPLFRYGAVGLIGNAVLARTDISIDHLTHTCVFGPPSTKPTPLGNVASATPLAVRKLALTYLEPETATTTLAQLEAPSFQSLDPDLAWLEDTSFPSAVKLIAELSPQQFGALVDRCSAIDDTAGLEALLAWAKAHRLDPKPWLSSTVTSAAIHGSNRILQILNRELGSIGFATPDGLNALHYACSGGYADTIRFCLDANISPTARGAGGIEPIAFLGSDGTAAAFDLMIARGASMQKPLGGINLAVAAAESENSPVVKKAVSAGFDPNWSNGDDRVTPLLMAAYNGDTDLVKFLVANGADPATKDNNGENALYYAIRGTGSAETYKALIDSGVPTDIISFEHGTLAECISAYASPQLLALTLAASKEPPNTSPFGLAPVATASRRGHFELIKALVAAGFDPTREDTDGISPLEWCAIGNHPGIVAYLLSQKDKLRPGARDIARSIH
ncbi:MAG: ankyrin repeat domain-containing protein, partial [Verrucomicrobiales bacterium]|nr:ankyrin repeat domain-containing protein [Verrucomicrobiales bacterium]